MFVHSCVHVCSFSEGLSLIPRPVFGPGSEATILHRDQSESNTDVWMLLSVKYSEISSRKITSLELISNL